MNSDLVKKIIVITVGLFGYGHILLSKNGTPKAGDFEEIVYNWMGTMAEVCQKTEQKHYNVGNPEECMVHAINGFLSCLDPHSCFLDPKTYASMLESTSGQFFGIGVVLDNTRQSKDGFLLVIDVVPGGPAEKKGIQRLDKIIEIEDKSLDGMTTDEALARLRGERNSSVSLKVVREGHPDMLSFVIVRDVIKEQHSHTFYFPEHHICYRALTVFSESALKEMEELIQQAEEKKYKAVIIDIRNNSGGLVNSAVDIASLFMRKGSVVVTIKDRSGTDVERYVTTREPRASGLVPVFFLTNNYTASAAEILVGALDDYVRSGGTSLMTFTVGTKTFGKGSVQEVIPVSNNCAMKITVALYFLPSGKTIQGIGIDPDFTVEQQLPHTEQMKWVARVYGQEASLRNSIIPEEKNNKKSKNTDGEKTKKDKQNTSWLERTKDILQNDLQLKHAITVANLYDTLRRLAPEKMQVKKDAIAYMNTLFAVGKPLEIVEIPGL